MSRAAWAYQKFRKGQSVHLTPLAFQQKLQGRGEYHGVVTSVGPRQLVSVRRLGRKHSQSWNMAFWTVCRSVRTCRKLEGHSGATALPRKDWTPPVKAADRIVQ